MNSKRCWTNLCCEFEHGTVFWFQMKITRTGFMSDQETRLDSLRQAEVRLQTKREEVTRYGRLMIQHSHAIQCSFSLVVYIFRWFGLTPYYYSCAKSCLQRASNEAQDHMFTHQPISIGHGDQSVQSCGKFVSCQNN